MAVDDLDYEVFVLDIFRGFEADDLALVVSVADLFFHDALADCRHLGTAVGIDDGSDNIAAECRADLIKKVGVFLACLGVFVVTYFK